MHRLTQMLMAVDKVLDHIIDAVRCPISGALMKDPVLMSDGITYERANIEDWIKKHNNRSPFSGQPFDREPFLNRAVRDMITPLLKEVENPLPVLRVRLRNSMQWIVRSKLPLQDFETAYEDFSMRRFKEKDVWPLSACPEVCVELTWTHCAHLRAMVYKEFTNAAEWPPNATDYIKQLASRWFVCSMKTNPHGSKTNQLISALEAAKLDVIKIIEELLRPKTDPSAITLAAAKLDASKISQEWKKLWEDTPTQTPSYQQENSRVVHRDLNQPQRQDYDDDWAEYGRYGSGHPSEWR